MLRLGFIGAGVVGTALAYSLSGRGYPVVAVASRSRVSAENLAHLVSGARVYLDSQGVADAAEFIFITTPDDAIAAVASQVRWHKGQSVVHCSGALSVDILEPSRGLGAYVGSFHPLQAFASVEQAMENLPGSTLAIEAEEPLLTTLKEMASGLGGRSIELKAGDKTLYHAAAVMASNYVVTLVKLAADLWQGFGVPPEAATHSLLPLLRGAVSNTAALGIPECLTGPITRGDIATIGKHLEALEASHPAILRIYVELGIQTVPIALAKGKLSHEMAGEISQLLKSYQ